MLFISISRLKYSISTPTDDVFEIVGVELPAVANKEDMLMEHIAILVKHKSTLKCQ